MKPTLFNILLLLLLFHLYGYGQKSKIVPTNPYQRLEYLLEASDEELFRNPQQSLTYAREALMLSYKLKNEYAAMQASGLLGRSYLNLDSLRQALKHTEIALDKSQKLNIDEFVARSLRLMGMVLMELNDFDGAAEYFYKALTQFENMNATDELSATNRTIGSMYFELREYEKSLQFYRKALHFAMQTQNKTDLALALDNIASVHGQLGNLGRAERYYHKALEINRKLQNKTLIAENYHNLGITVMEMGRMDEARQHLKKCIYLFDSLQSSSDLLPCKLSLADYYVAQQCDSAVSIAQLVYSQSDSSMLELKSRACEILYNYYTKQGEKDSLIRYGYLFYELEAEINLGKHVADVQNLELRDSFQKQQYQAELKAKQKQFNQVIVIFSLVLLLIFSIWLSLRLRKKNIITEQEKKNLDLELEIKNKELMTNVMLSMQRNDVIAEVKEELQVAGEKAVKQETKKTLDQVSKKLGEAAKQSVWAEFEMRFKNVHLDFYKNLDKDFPDLTNNEKRMCAFLKLNMSTKEISSLTGQSIPAIEKARNRLRKKLGIVNSEVNLVAFIGKY